MKHVVVGDTHGRDYWKKILEKEKPSKIIFIGDYFDSYDIPYLEQMQNFKEILELEDAIRLTGNHDYHYLPSTVGRGEYYSGFQGGAVYMDIGQAVSNAIHEGKLTMAYQHREFLFTHAGVTMTWLLQHGISLYDDIPQKLNDLLNYKPRVFHFNGVDHYGDDITQSPIWVRPKSLLSDSRPLGFVQVVGHTRVMNINPEGVDGKYYFIDVFDSRIEYLIIEDGKVRVGTLTPEDLQ